MRFLPFLITKNPGKWINKAWKSTSIKVSEDFCNTTPWSFCQVLMPIFQASLPLKDRGCGFSWEEFLTWFSQDWNGLLVLSKGLNSGKKLSWCLWSKAGKSKDTLCSHSLWLKFGIPGKKKVQINEVEELQLQTIAISVELDLPFCQEFAQVYFLYLHTSYKTSSILQATFVKL